MRFLAIQYDHDHLYLIRLGGEELKTVAYVRNQDRMGNGHIYYTSVIEASPSRSKYVCT